MANIQERRNKNGQLVSFSVRVFRGRGEDGKQLKPWTATFKVSPTWTEKGARRKAEAFAVEFERECREREAREAEQAQAEEAARMQAAKDQPFAKYCDYVLTLKESRGVKHSTIVRWRELAQRVNEYIGNTPLSRISASDLNNLYTELSKNGANKRTGGPLSAKTILEHHRLISAVLAQAFKEDLIPINTAQKADVPKCKAKDPNYFQPETVAAIREALEGEPMKWRVLTHLLLITGARRGEVLGLKWDAIDWDSNRLHIERTIMYQSDVGIYEETPKTARSVRWISVPGETIALLKKYRSMQTMERLKLGEWYNYQGYVFTQENGNPMHPDSVTDWLAKFSRRHDLPHINPHAFRHTMASMLYYNGVDSVSISARLGHAQVSTTANIYAHVIEKADLENAAILENIFLRAKA